MDVNTMIEVTHQGRRISIAVDTIARVVENDDHTTGIWFKGRGRGLITTTNYATVMDRIRNADRSGGSTSG